MRFITANVYNKNPHIERDLRLLVGTGALGIGLNEAGTYQPLIAEIAADGGYQVHGAGDRGTTCILLRDEAEDVTTEKRQTAYPAGGSQVTRWGTCSKFTRKRRRYALLNVHLNAGAQDREDFNRPRDIPREQVESYAASVKMVTDWAVELRNDGCRTVVTGDMNWAWTGGPAWRWSPERAFAERAGMKCQFDYGRLRRPEGDRRAIEYIFFHEDDFSYRSQRFVGPETSDHPFHEVSLTPR